LLFAAGASVFAAAKTPTEQVREVVDEVLALLADQSLEQEARRAQIREAIAPHFDFEGMSRSILARNWKKATSEQKQRFIELFKQRLENTYIVAMENYSGETVRYGKEKVDGKRASVATFIVRPSGVETPVTYRLRTKSDEWIAYDVIAEGVSLLSNYRSSYQSIVKKDGIDGLLAQMAEKADEPPKQ
jgi:phospholipid transport system substrate-binding protein